MARAQHLGITGCGVHFQKGGCDFDSIRAMFDKDRSTLKDHLFPGQMTARALKLRDRHIFYRKRCKNVLKIVS